MYNSKRRRIEIETLSPEIKNFVERFVDSFVSWDLIVFFHLNSGTIDTCKGLSSRLGRKESEVKNSLEELCEKGLLRKRVGGGKEVYFYSPPPHLKDVVDKFVKNLEDRSFRLRILSYLLKKGVK